MKLSLINILLVSVVLTSCKPGVNQRPNILIMMVDDLGKEWLSCYGAEDIVTTNIDKLAESGMIFHNVYSMPQCTPSRLSILTGQYPYNHGWVNHWDVPRWGGGAHFDERLNPSIALEMKKLGYKTAISGKWQIDDFRVEEDALLKSGFDHFCMWTGYETGIASSAERYHDPYIFTEEGSKTYYGKFGPDIFKDFLVDFIHAHSDSPMFLYYPMVLPHTPLVNPPQDSARDNMGKHKAMVRYVDRITGDIYKALEEAGIRDNTVFIWTTDNGTTQQIVGNYQGRAVRGGKSNTTEAGINAPFIVSWPSKIDPSSSTDALVDFTDFFPTCIDLAGGHPESEYRLGDTMAVIDGVSFKSVLESGGLKSERKWILSMGGKNNARLTENGVENKYVYRDRVLRNKRYKLYIDTHRKPVKFIDLLADPTESHNLMDSLTNEDRRQNFSELLESAGHFPIKDHDPKYIPNPPQPWDVEISASSQTWKK